MTVLIDPNSKVQLNFVINKLRANYPIALPTETVYGLAARATSEIALARIFELKARPKFDPLIVHVLDLRKALRDQLIQKPTALHEKLIEKFWPGPLTLLFPKSDRIPDLCTASTPWVALRSPEHPVFRKILEELDEPLAAPSANRFQSISPTSSKAVIDELGAYGLEAVVEGGASVRGIESTVVKVLSENEIEIVRQGALSKEEISGYLGPQIKIQIRLSGSGVEILDSQESPGQSPVHYSPKKKLFYLNPVDLEKFLNNSENSNWALLEVFPTHFTHPKIRSHLILSRNHSWSEAAAQLFSSLRQLDQDNLVEGIVALECSEESLGAAISDRLRRASQKH